MRTFLTNAAVALATVTLTTGVVAFADPANAATGIEKVSTVVQVADLNLHTEAGRATAHQRIRNAVDTVCGNEDSTDLKAAQCRSQATDHAKQALDRIAAL